MKKNIVIVLMICVFTQTNDLKSQAIPINKFLFGINAWYINFAQTNSTFGDEFISRLGSIKASGCTHVRIGGIDPNWEQPYNFNNSTREVLPAHVTRLEKLVKAIRGAGMEVILQVSYSPSNACPSFSPQSLYSSLGSLTLTQQAEVAGNLVAVLNKTVFPGNERIQYWSIANEPDQPVPNCSNSILVGGYSASLASTVTGVSSATFIADYIQKFSKAMKEQDDDIYIMGPDLAAFGNDPAQNGQGGYHAPGSKIMKDLLSSPSNTYSILGSFTSNAFNGSRPYIDIVAFHHYPGFDPTFSTAASLLNQPGNHVKSFAQHLQSNNSSYNGLVNMITGAGRSAANCSIACTEFNLEMYDHEGTIDESTTNGYAQMINGFGNRSFLGGQWLCEMFAEAMKPNQIINTTTKVPWVSMMSLWSAKEGDCVRGLGYFSSCNTPNGSSSYADYKRPMFWHYEMMANNFKGAFYTSTLNVNNSAVNDIKAYAAQGTDRVAVLIINQSSSNKNFYVELEGTVPTTSGLNISFNIPNTSTVGYTGDNSDPEHAQIEANSTVLLLFNCKGTPSERRDYTKAMVLSDPHAVPYVTDLGTPLAGLYGSTLTVIPVPNQTNVLPITITNTTGMSVIWPAVGPCGGPIPNTNSGLQATLAICNGGTTAVVYTYTVQDPEGCKKEEQHTIQGGLITPLGNHLFGELGTPQAASCGLNNGQATIYTLNHEPGGPSSSWDNGSWIAGASNSSLSPGLHTVRVSAKVASAAATASFMTFHVYIAEIKPAIDAGNNLYAGNNCPVYLSAFPNLTSSGYSYEWTKGASTTTFSNVYSTSFLNWGSDWYKVKVTKNNLQSCFNVDSVLILNTGLKCYPKASSVAMDNAYPCPPPTGKSTEEQSSETVTLTVNTLINSDSVIDQRLVVPNGVTLTIENCQLAFTDSARIIVQAGGTLVGNKVKINPCFSPIKLLHVVGTSTSSARLSLNECMFDNGSIAIENCRSFIIENCIFVNTPIAITIKNCEDYFINRNYFYTHETALKFTDSPLSEFNSYITENVFEITDTALICLDGDHSTLEVSCNTFKTYNSYAFYSNNVTLADQGDATTGAGNKFTSSSSLTNHRFRHNGNNMTYYCDPTGVFTLTVDPQLHATADTAANSAVCPRWVNVNRTAPSDSLNLKFEPLNDIQAIVYPNPFNDQLTIELNLPVTAKSAVITMYEAGSGKLILNKSVKQDEHKLILESLEFSAGLYICRIQADDGSVKHFKVVKTQ